MRDKHIGFNGLNPRPPIVSVCLSGLRAVSKANKGSTFVTHANVSGAVSSSRPWLYGFQLSLWPQKLADPTQPLQAMDGQRSTASTGTSDRDRRAASPEPASAAEFLLCDPLEPQGIISFD